MDNIKSILKKIEERSTLIVRLTNGDDIISYYETSEQASAEYQELMDELISAESHWVRVPNNEGSSMVQRLSVIAVTIN